MRETRGAFWAVICAQAFGCGARSDDPTGISDAGVPDSGSSVDAGDSPVIVPFDCAGHSCEGVELEPRTRSDETLGDGSLELTIGLANCGGQPLPFAVPVLVRRTVDPERVEARAELADGLRPGTLQLLTFRLPRGTWEDTQTEGIDCLVFEVDPDDQLSECNREDDSVEVAYGIACAAL